MPILDLVILKDAIVDTIKIKSNTDPTKTQGVKLRPLLVNIVDTLLNSIDSLRTELLDKLAQLPALPTLPDFTLFAKKTDIPTPPDLTPFAKKTDLFSKSYLDLTNKPDFTNYQLKTDSIAYSRLLGAPTIPAPPDLSGYQLKTDSISYSRIIGAPIPFSGSYSDLANKPTIVTSYTQLSDKPTIITDYTQLTNKPSMSKLLWNQISPFTLTNSTSETNALVLGNGAGVLSLEANPSVGTGFRLTGRGLFNTQTLAPTPTLSIKLYLGSTQIASGNVSSFLLGANNKPLSFYIDILVDSPTTVYTQGSMTYFGAATDILSAAPITNNGLSTTINFSTANQLRMTLTWNLANTANTIQMKIINLEKLNN